ncbi:protein NLRC3-like [Hoplias malabaricus]|uniref:protein NLRC3-like n=1 Tax=Hoplias malabaricus TaxID=27720 RepID=UPI0034618FCB
MSYQPMENKSISSLEEQRKLQQETATLSDHSCVSLKSDNSKECRTYFQKEKSSANHRTLQQETATSPESSCVSMKSDNSMDFKDYFQKGNCQSKHGPFCQASTLPEHRCETVKSNQFIEHTGPICNEDFSEHRPEEELLKNHKLNLKQTSQFVFSETAKHGNPILLSHIYTDLYIVEGESGEISRNHEVRLIEKTSLQPARKDIPVRCNELFKTTPGQQQKIRTVMTKGVAGIGKTISVQKFILDWAEGEANQDIQIILPLPFRELNLMRERKLSLVDLLHHFFKEIQGLEEISNYKILLIFDGLDECRLPLNFQKRERCSDVRKCTSVDSLLTSLIKGNLLPSALIWITSRPAAASQIPSAFIDRVTEVRGFKDPQKEEFFRKRITSQSLANKVIMHIKSSRSLYIMCHIPVFCWLSAAVLERTLCQEENEETPNTLMQMYTHFLIIQTRIKHEKYTEVKETDKVMILKLGNLAFQQLCKGNLIFYETDLKKCGIDIKEASVYSGLFTQIFREEFGLAQRKVFSFVHLSIQEHLAALYVFYCFIKSDQVSDPTTELAFLLKASSIFEFHKAAVDMALKSENGHLDLFLRFLLGLSLESSQSLLQNLFEESGDISKSNEETVEYIKTKIREDPSSDRRINLFYCLVELNHYSIVEILEKSTRALSVVMLIPEKWSTLTFEFHKLVEELNDFDLRKYIGTPMNDLNEFLTPDDVLLRLLPAVKTARSAKLKGCSLTDKGCKALASAFSTNQLKLIELNLRENRLRDTGMKLFCTGLASLHCKLETLELRYCNLGVGSCESLASALSSNSSCLKELNLRDNKQMLDSGIIHLCKGLQSENCKLEILLLSGCMLSDKSCEALASVLSFRSSSLRELELSSNKVQDTGVELLCAGLRNPHCNLEKLHLCRCKLTEKSCAALASAIHPNSNLRELYLSGNKLQDSGVNGLLALKKNQHSKLDKLIW